MTKVTMPPYRDHLTLETGLVDNSCKVHFTRIYDDGGYFDMSVDITDKVKTIAEKLVEFEEGRKIV